MSTENAPDVFQHVQQISPDAGNNLWKGVGQGIDNFINGLIERVGEIGGAAMVAAVAKGVDVAANAASATVSTATAPFKEGFVASASPERSEGRSPDMGKGKELAVESPSVSASQESAKAVHVNDVALGELTPNVSFSKGPMNQSRSV